MATLFARPCLVVSGAIDLGRPDMGDLSDHCSSLVDKEGPAILECALIAAVREEFFNRLGLDLKSCVVFHFTPCRPIKLARSPTLRTRSTRPGRNPVLSNIGAPQAKQTPRRHGHLLELSIATQHAVEDVPTVPVAGR